MKTKLRKSFVIMLFFVFITSIMTGCSYHFSIQSGHILKKEDAKEFTVEKTEVDTIKQIEIHTRIANVELIPSDKFSVEINYLYWDEQPEYQIIDNQLYFNDKDCLPEAYTINFHLDNQIKIYLPKDASLDELTINSASGDINLSSFIAKDMKVSISYGDLKLNNAAAENAEFHLASGNTTMNDFQVGKMDFASSYGNCKFTNMNTGKKRIGDDISYEIFKVKASSGDITIDEFHSSTLSINDSYGDVSLNDIKADHLKSNLSSGDIDISKSDISDLDLRNSYGDADLNLTGTESDYSLNLSTSYGDIRVDNISYDNHRKTSQPGERKLTADLSSGDLTINFENN